MKIHILVCDWFEGLLPDFVPSFPKLFIDLFSSIASDISYQIYDVPGGEMPANINKEDLYLITGSRAGAYEKITWIKNIIRFVQRAFEANARLTGSCFGYQVIAQALGGKVEPASQGWGAGVRVSNIVYPKELQYFPERKISLYYNHNDQVIKLPPQAERIATSDFCINEAFRIGDRIVTFQGHPEYTKEYMQHVIHIATHVTEEVKLNALESIKKEKTNQKAVAKFMLQR